MPLVLYRDVYGAAPTEEALRIRLARLPQRLMLGLLTALAALAAYGIDIGTRSGQLELLSLCSDSNNSQVYESIYARARFNLRGNSGTRSPGNEKAAA
jgi:hypothetical protein